MRQAKVKFIAQNNSELIEKFINYLMLAGKKTVARRILKDCFEIIQKKTKKKGAEIFEEAINNTKPAMEIRAKRVGGSVYQIPIEVKPIRRFQLASRWILNAARSKKGAQMSKKLADELIAASKNEGSAIKKKEDTHRMAQANKAFAHFARY